MVASAFCFVFFFKHKTAYEMRISDWSSDVCSSDLVWESAILLGRMALEKLGVEGGQIDRIDLEYRRRDEERLALQSVSGDLHSGNEMMFHRSGPLPAATPVDAEDK